MHGKWVTFAARVYYVIGLTYYLYHWLLIAGAGGLAIGVVTHAINRNHITFGLAPLSVSLLLWGIALLARKRALEFQSHNPGLQEKLSDSTYTVRADNSYYFSRRLIVQAKHDGVDHYVGKFRWSGGRHITAVPAASYPHRVTLSPQPHDIHMICRIDFERPLRKKEVLEFSYALEMRDIEGTAEQFISNSIYYRSEKVITRVRLDTPPPNLRYYRRQILASNTADMPIYEERVNLQDGNEELFWEVKNPRIGYRYKIIW